MCKGSNQIFHWDNDYVDFWLGIGYENEIKVVIKPDRESN